MSPWRNLLTARRTNSNFPAHAAPMLTHYLESRPTLTERLANQIEPMSNKVKREKIIQGLVSLGLIAQDSNAQDYNVANLGAGAVDGRADRLLAELEELAGCDESAKKDVGVKG